MPAWGGVTLTAAGRPGVGPHFPEEKSTGENGNLERASDVFRGKKAPLLGARLGKFRPKKAPLRIRSSQKRPFSYMHFPAKKTIPFVLVSGITVIRFQIQFRQRLSQSDGGVGRRGLDVRLRYAIVAPHGPSTLPKRLHVPPTRAGLMPQKVLWTRCSRRCQGYH